jgi:serine phosphatase RsbU (regulator of sigma subunit)
VNRETAGPPGPSSAVLLVEDDDGDALLVREGLELAAPELALHRVETLGDALAGLPDGVACVLLDLGLPDTVGLDGLRRLRQSGASAAVVVLTGRDDEALGIEALGAGAQDYLVKGQAEPAILARAIRYAIERRRAELSEQELLGARLQALENARLERGLLPTALIRDERLRLTCDYRPGRRRALLGGDFYDAVELDDSSVHAMIGDVCGHGADEAALGACLRAAWRGLALGLREPEQVMSTLHRMLPHESHAPDVFATLCTVEIPADRRSICVRLAGHPPPIAIDGSGPRLLDVSGATPPLGIFDQSEWPGERVELGDSWALLLYTDGLVEGRVGDGPDRLGERRLVELVERRLAAGVDWRTDAKRLLDDLIAEVERLNGEPLTDDIAVVLLAAGGD